MTDRGTQFHPSWDTASGFQADVRPIASGTSWSTPHSSSGEIAVITALDGNGIESVVVRPRDIYVWNGSAWVLPAP